jgi:hypothetical protein
MTRAKRMNLPFATGLIEVQKLRQKLGYVSCHINTKHPLPEIILPVGMIPKGVP